MPTRTISPLHHGLIDYLLVAVLLIAPSLLGLSPASAWLAHASGLILLVTSLLTAYPAGPVHAVPFYAHGVIEVGLASLLLFLSMLTALGHGLLFVVGAIVAFVAALTDYRRTALAPQRARVHARIPSSR